jgi:hypothetical protein
MRFEKESLSGALCGDPVIANHLQRQSSAHFGREDAYELHSLFHGGVAMPILPQEIAARFPEYE